MLAPEDVQIVRLRPGTMILAYWDVSPKTLGESEVRTWSMILAYWDFGPIILR